MTVPPTQDTPRSTRHRSATAMNTPFTQASACTRTTSQGRPAERQVYNGRRRVTRCEHELLGVPQVRLAVHGQDSVQADESGAVVDQAILAQLTEPARDRRAVP